MAVDIQRVEKPIRKVRKLLKKMSAQPTPKEVHDLRTNSRRLEATLEAIDPGQNGRKVLKLISRLRKHAGKVRDMDVLTAYASGLPREGDEEECSVRLLEYLGAERDGKARKLHKAAQNDSPELRKRLRKTSGELEKAITRANARRSGASSQITAAALKSLSELEEPSSLGKTNLHPYRVKVKELQNLLRLAEDNKDEQFVESLGAVKDAIGEWHDWEELQSIATEVIDHPRCHLLRAVRKNTDERLRRALALTEEMRRKYLYSSADRMAKRKPSHTAESVWSATAALSA